MERPRRRLTGKRDAPVAKAAGRFERRPFRACRKSRFRGRLGRAAVRSRPRAAPERAAYSDGGARFAPKLPAMAL